MYTIKLQDPSVQHARDENGHYQPNPTEFLTSGEYSRKSQAMRGAIKWPASRAYQPVAIVNLKSKEECPLEVS